MHRLSLKVVLLSLVSSVTAIGQPVYFADANLKAKVELRLGKQNPTVADMRALTWLNGTDGRISNLTGLEHAANLESLELGYNQITNVSALAGLSKLELVFLHNNRISDISPLSGLRKLKVLELSSNPLNYEACAVSIPRIVANNPGILLFHGPCATQRSKYTLAASSTSGGSVTVPGEGTFEYDKGASAPIVATRDAGYEFVNWTGTALDAGKVVDPTSASTSVTMNADYTLVANFRSAVSVQIYNYIEPQVSSSRIVLYNPPSDSPKLILKANGQPTGGTFHWRIARGIGRVGFFGSADENNYVETGGHAAVKPLAPSNQLEDTLVEVTYILGAASCKATHPITVQKPDHLTLKSHGLVKPDPADFYAHEYMFEVWDQLHPANILYATQKIPVPVAEKRPVYCESFFYKRLVQPKYSLEFWTFDGSFVDHLALPRPIWYLNWTPWIPPSYMSKIQQEIRVAGWPISVRCLTFYRDDAKSVEGQCSGGVLGFCTSGRQLSSRTGTINRGERHDHAVHVDSAVSQVSFGLSSTADLDLALLAPDGLEISPETVGLHSNIELVEEPGRMSYVVQQAAPGDWTMRVSAGTTLQNSEDYSIEVTATSSVSLELILSPTGWSTGEPIPLGAELLHDTVGVMGGSVVAQVERPDGAADQLVLYDDGAHDDGARDDGYYSNTYGQTWFPGMYTVTLRATGPLGDDWFERTASATIYVGDCPDLGVDVSGIRFSDQTPSPSQSIIIFADVANIGLGDAEGAIVCLYDGSPDTGDVLAQRTIDLPAGQSKTVEVEWIIPVGEHEVFVAVYPSETYLEENYENNVASRIIDAGPADANDAEPVYFEAPNLQTEVEMKLGVSEPNASDMLSLYSLSASGDITKLVGLEHATNLRHLWLPENQITSIDPLLALVYLERVDLGGNQISDVSPLAQLSELQYLDLSDNEISDISPLSSLTALNWLDLRGNPLNTEAYATYIPLIEANNPGITLLYDRQCALMVSSTEGGTVTVSSSEGGPFSPVADGPYTCLCRETTYFSYQPDDGYRFVGWSGTLVNAGVVDPTSPVAEVTLSQPIVIVPAEAGFTLTANFQRIQPQECTLTISSTSGGSVTEPGEGIFTYQKGTEVSLLAVADPGYEFTHWSGNVSSSSDPLTITMNHNVVVTANFEFVPGYTLTTKVEPARTGSVTRSPDKARYDPGEEVTLTANPATGYAFWYWSSNTSWPNPVTVTVDRDRTITAKFEPWPYPKYKLTVSSTNGGSVVEPGEGTFNYVKYTDVSLSAVAEPGYTFAAWRDDGGHVISRDNPLEITVLYDRSIEALFEEEGTAYTLTIDIVPPEGGTVTRTPDKATYAPSERVDLEVIPAPGYSFDHCSGALCKIQLGTGKITGSVIMDSDRSVTVTFRPAP